MSFRIFSNAASRVAGELRVVLLLAEQLVDHTGNRPCHFFGPGRIGQNAADELMPSVIESATSMIFTGSRGSAFIISETEGPILSAQAWYPSLVRWVPSVNNRLSMKPSGIRNLPFKFQSSIPKSNF